MADSSKPASDVGGVTLDENREMVTCPECKGTGHQPPGGIVHPNGCVHCGGTGKVTEEFASYYRDSVEPPEPKAGD